MYTRMFGVSFSPDKINKGFLVLAHEYPQYRMPVLYPLNQPRSMVSSPTPIGKSNFALDTSGLASVFGGPEAIFSLALVHVYPGRRWLGWYNSPGSYFLGKRLAHIAHSNPILNIISKSGEHSQSHLEKHIDPAELFEYDGRKGPKFRAIHSGTILDETGHSAALFLKECAETHAKKIPGRVTCPVDVIIANLHHTPPESESPAKFHRGMRASIDALIPIIISFAACATSGLYHDWYCFSVILLGIIANGLSCLVVGSGELIFTHPRTTVGLPAGDGFLSTPEQVVLLSGDEGAVNSITRGKFSLRFDNDPLFRTIGTCAMLHLLQSVAQLILVPQGSLFGQLMFVASIAVSWSYNLWLSSFNKESIQRKMLMGVLDTPTLTKFTLGTRTSMAVFVLLALNAEKPEEVLNHLLPNDTEVWKRWKSAILERLKSGKELRFHESDWNDPTDGNLLKMLYNDAQEAYEGFEEHMTPGLLFSSHEGCYDHYPCASTWSL